MPIPKKTRDERVARGLCQLCDNPRTTVKKTGKPSKFCQAHLDYFRTYQQSWRAENGPPKHNRCSVCRSIEHNISECPDPRAEAFRAALKSRAS